MGTGEKRVEKHRPTRKYERTRAHPKDKKPYTGDRRQDKRPSNGVLRSGEDQRVAQLFVGIRGQVHVDVELATN